MATAPRIITLNLGSQTVGLAEFHAQPYGGLVLTGYRLREILADPSMESDRLPQITASLREMMAELGIRGGPVNYAVAGQSVFARFVKLPAVEQDKIDRIITFEAQQNVPFPIDEVVWDYQLVASSDAEKIEVVLVAIKADLLEGINAAVEATGLRTTLVDVATMALYNAFRYNYSELSGCSLLIDVGARTTNLIFIEPGKVFSRSVPIGGSSITAAIAKEFGEPFAAAELRKKNDAFVGLGGAYAEAADAGVARVSKLVRSTMTRLHAELARSISFYRSQQQGSAPERAFLCGRTAGMPYMREFFHEKLQQPIEFFNPLRNVTVAASVQLDEISRSAYLLGELVGLALRGTVACPMELNLRPATVVRRQQLAQRRPFLMIAAACFLLGLLGWAFYFLRSAHIAAAAADRLQSEQVEPMRRLESRIDQLRKERTALDAIATPLLGTIADRGAWPRILEELNVRLPKQDIWITELAPMSGENILGEGVSGQATPPPAPVSRRPRGPGAVGPARPAIDGVFVRGLYLSNPKQQEIVVDYFRNLVGSTIFAVDPDNQSQVIRPTMPTSTEWAFPYELRLHLRQPIALP